MALSHIVHVSRRQELDLGQDAGKISHSGITHRDPTLAPRQQAGESEYDRHIDPEHE